MNFRVKTYPEHTTTHNVKIENILFIKALSLLICFNYQD
jgi:hypothetical protein